MIAVFAGPSYYPMGGWQDLDKLFETEAEARLHVAARKIRAEAYEQGDEGTDAEADEMGWVQIVDLAGPEKPLLMEYLRHRRENVKGQRGRYHDTFTWEKEEITP